MNYIATTAIALLLATTGAFAAEIKEIPALDVAVDAEALQGQKVKITGCTIIGAGLDSMLCGVNSKSGSVGTISVLVEKLDRTQFKQALENCAGITHSKDCAAVIVGVIGKNILDDPAIFAEQILWEK